MRKIKGFVTYDYKGVQYFEKPRNTYISKIEYDEAEKMSTVYLKRSTYLVEFLCILSLCFMVYFVYTGIQYSQTVHMPDSAYYYDGKLFVNIVADEDNTDTVSCCIAGYNGILNPGDSIEFIDYEYNEQTSEEVSYTVDVLWFSRTFSRTIPVGTLQFDGGVEDEGY